MGLHHRGVGARRPPAAAPLLRRPPGRRPAVAPDRPRRRRVRRVGPVLRPADALLARHAPGRAGARRARFLACPAGQRGGVARAGGLVGRRGAAGRDSLLGVDGRLPAHSRRRSGRLRSREVHGPRVPELARPVSRNAAGRPVDVRKDHQLLLLGIPAGRRAGQALGAPAAPALRPADGRLQPLRGELPGIRLRVRRLPRVPAFARPPRRRAGGRGRHRVRRQRRRRPRRVGRAVRQGLRLLACLARHRGRQHDQRVPVLHLLPRGPAPPPAGVSVLRGRVRGRSPLHRARDRARRALARMVDHRGPLREAAPAGARRRNGLGREPLERAGARDPADRLGHPRDRPGAPAAEPARGVPRGPLRRPHRRRGPAAVPGVPRLVPAREPGTGPGGPPLGVDRAARRLGNLVPGPRARPLAGAARGDRAEPPTARLLPRADRRPARCSSRSPSGRRRSRSCSSSARSPRARRGGRWARHRRAAICRASSPRSWSCSGSG